MANKTLITRVQSKYDTYKNWETNDPVLLKGEIAVTVIEADDDGAVVNKPGVYIKIGDGANKWSDLGFIAASAGDVSAWAKTPDKPTYTADEISGIEDKISEIADTDTKYQLIKDPQNEGKLLLQSATKDAPSEWTTVSTIDINESIKISESSKSGDNQLQVEEDGLYVPKPPEYTLKKKEQAEEGFSATYELQKDGVKVGDAINLAKDLLIKSAEIKTAAEGVPEGFHEGEKYIDFTLNGEGGDQHIYLNVKDIAVAYTAGNGIDISEGNEISVVINGNNGLSVTESGIKLDVASSDAAGAMSSADKAKLDKIEDPEQLLKKDLSNVESQALKEAVEAAGIEEKTYTAGNGITVAETEISVKVKTESSGGLKADAEGLYIEEATSTTAGAMSAGDKEKLDKIVPDNLVNKDLSNVESEALSTKIKETVATNSIYEAGNGVEINETSIAVKVSQDTGLKLAEATGSSAGAMSSEMYNKIEGLHAIATSGNVNDLVQTPSEVLILDCGGSEVTTE